MTTINLGSVKVVQSSTSGVQSRSGNEGTVYESRPMSHSELRQLSEPTLLQPAQLQSSDMKLARVLKIASSSDDVLGTIVHYKGTNGRWFIIKQFYDKPETREVPFAFESATIGGRPAAFYTFTVLAENQPGGMIDLQVFLWEHGPFLLEMQGALLSRNELIAIGNSLIGKAVA